MTPTFTDACAIVQDAALQEGCRDSAPIDQKIAAARKHAEELGERNEGLADLVRQCCDQCERRAA